MRNCCLIPILFIDCRISDLVIPRIKYGAGSAEAGIQVISISIMVNSFGKFLTVIGIIWLYKNLT
jgi:hypothetical protein